MFIMKNKVHFYVYVTAYSTQVPTIDFGAGTVDNVCRQRCHSPRAVVVDDLPGQKWLN